MKKLLTRFFKKIMFEIFKAENKLSRLTKMWCSLSAT